jgi:neurotransmitter:Na+ symporter, NSS family
MSRESWGSRIGFTLAVAGSAIGLANIWRFPYVVGKYGGAAFVIVYILCLLLIGFPVFISEMLIGKASQTSPSGAFRKIGRSEAWSWAGKLTILTGFIVSAFYSAIAGWILGYLVEAFQGTISSFQNPGEAVQNFNLLMDSPVWGIGFHLLFILLSLTVLYAGIRNGIERGNKIFMPLLFIVLIFLVVKGLSMPNAWKGLEFLFSPDWSLLTPTAILIALGQSFFTLSLGQGTMVTYGSYLNQNENLLKSCFPAVIMDTIVSLLSAIAVFTIVFSVGIQPDSGPGLIFHTLPWVFSQIPGGYLVSIMFFLLVSLAALTSEISALEPTISYLVDERGWKRHNAVLGAGIGAFLLGIPCALSSSVLKDFKLFGSNSLDLMANLASNILIPVGGLLAVILVGWVWGFHNVLDELKKGSNSLYERRPLLVSYFKIGIKYTAPILIILVFLNALGFLF